MKIQTVTGEVDTAELGAVLMHEHLFVLDRNFAFAFPDWYDEEEGLARFCAAIEALKPYGLRTFVDATAINMGRDVRVLKRAAEMTGIHIVATTGLYTQEEPSMNLGVHPDVLAKYLIREVTEGIQGTSIRAGIIKCSSDMPYGVDFPNECMIRGAARASLATGVPITTHASAKHKLGLRQQSILKEEGVPLHRVVIGHAFSSSDLDYVEELIANGSYVGCDQIGFEELNPMERLAEMIGELCRKGYEDHIMLSHDQATISDYGLAFSDYCRDFENNVLIGTYHLVFDRMPDLLKKNGVSQAQIDKMLWENPRRFFEGRPFGS